jgi:hypothetical protein
LNDLQCHGKGIGFFLDQFVEGLMTITIRRRRIEGNNMALKQAILLKPSANTIDDDASAAGFCQT